MTSLLDPVRGVASDLAAPLLRLVGAAPPRRVDTARERSHLEVRGIHRGELDESRRLLEKQLTALPGVRAAAVNAVLARVVVDHDATVTLADLLGVIAEVEDADELGDPGSSVAGGRHPGDGTARHRQLVALAVDVAGLGVVLTERALIAVPIASGLVPPVATAMLSLAESVPSLRALVERTAGQATTESWFSIGAAGAQALGRGPVGLVTDACYRWLRAREAGARRRAWHEFDTLLEIDEHRAEPGTAHEATRPAALRAGSVQRVGDTAGASALSGMAVVAMLVPARATAVALAGAPKAARWGWEAFAAAVGHGLARRSVVVLDPAALRRADRVDVVVVEPALPEAVVSAAGTIGRVVVTPTAAAADTVAELQAGGHGVAVLSTDPEAAETLVAADVAVFVGSSAAAVGRPAAVWAADLLCADADGALAVLAVLAAAPAAARRAAAIAVAASCAALPVAVLAPLPGLHRWASLPVSSGALVSLGVGTWTGSSAVPVATS